MTAPMPAAPMVTASTEVRRDPQGNTIIVLRIGCGPVSTECFIGPGDAERFGQDIADALRTAAERARALPPAIVVPPKGFVVPRVNGGRP